MKLIVQIPCYNEAETLPLTVADIPRRIPGVDSVEILVIDDGSTDRTSDVARQLGVDHVVRHRANRGLARSFRTGLDACLRLGADIIVNTDGDNQYCGADIPCLIAPILAGDADIVIGDRCTRNVAHFSSTKKLLQTVGSFVVRHLSETTVPDAVSGFRAFSRQAALRTNIVSDFSYTIETIIQAGNKQMAIRSVPIRTNRKLRESRLFKSIPQFVGRSLGTMVRMYAMYRPLRVFTILSLLLMAIGGVPVMRFAYLFLIGDGSGHIQSLVLGGVFLTLGFLLLMIGLVADLISFNRQLLEMALEALRRIQLGEESDASYQGVVTERVSEDSDRRVAVSALTRESAGRNL